MTRFGGRVLGAAIQFLIVALAGQGRAADAASDFIMELVDGRLQAGPEVVKVMQHDRVRPRWRSDREIELHLHGYDRKIAVPRDGEAVLQFDASATGRFPVTLHHHDGQGHATLIYLEVHPN